MDERARRFTENELRFRSVNEEIDDLADDVAPEVEPQVWDFLCECHDATCRVHVPMTRREYSGVRANPRWFAVAPAADHVSGAVERVVDRSSRYWIVEKTGEAGELAEEAAEP